MLECRAGRCLQPVFCVPQRRLCGRATRLGCKPLVGPGRSLGSVPGTCQTLGYGPLGGEICEVAFQMRLSFGFFVGRLEGGKQCDNAGFVLYKGILVFR